MRSQNDKATWSILRFDHRTFTAQLASMQKNKQIAAIPEKYIYIDDKIEHGLNFVFPDMMQNCTALR